MVSTNMYTLTQQLKGVFVDAKMVDDSNKTGPSFTEITQMDEFWQVHDSLTLILTNSLVYLIVYDRNSCSRFIYRNLV